MATGNYLLWMMQVAILEISQAGVSHLRMPEEIFVMEVISFLLLMIQQVVSIPIHGHRLQA